MEGERPEGVESAQADLIQDPKAMESMQGPYNLVESFSEEKKSAILTKQGLINLFGDNELLDQWLNTNRKNGVFEKCLKENSELPLPSEVSRKMQLTKLRINKDGKFWIGGYAWDASDVKEDLEMIGYKFPEKPESLQDAA